MPARYQVHLYDTSGNRTAVMDRWRTLNIEHSVNGVSNLTLSLYTGMPEVQLFALDTLIEVRRRWPEAGIDWYTEFIGFHRTPQKQITEANTRIYTSYAVGLLDLIRRRSIRYFADTDGSAKGPAPADNVIKDYVRENAGSLATLANGRVTDGVTPGLLIAGNLSQGPVFEGAFAWQNLLQTCAKIGEPNRVDFDVVWLGGISFEFRTYYPQLGTDRRVSTGSPFSFAPGLGNMTSPSYTLSRTDEISSVLVLGPGEGPLRDVTPRQSVFMRDSPWNLIEQDHDASSEDREAALNAIGDGVLYDKRPSISMPFTALQTPNSAYRQHYFLGDIVTGAFEDVSANMKISGVSVNASEQAEQVTLRLEEYAPSGTETHLSPG